MSWLDNCCSGYLLITKIKKENKFTWRYLVTISFCLMISVLLVLSLSAYFLRREIVFLLLLISVNKTSGVGHTETCGSNLSKIHRAWIYLLGFRIPVFQVMLSYYKKSNHILEISGRVPLAQHAVSSFIAPNKIYVLVRRPPHHCLSVHDCVVMLLIILIL